MRIAAHILTGSAVWNFINANSIALCCKDSLCIIGHNGAFIVYCVCYDTTGRSLIILLKLGRMTLAWKHPIRMIFSLGSQFVHLICYGRKKYCLITHITSIKQNFGTSSYGSKGVSYYFEVHK